MIRRYGTYSFPEIDVYHGFDFDRSCHIADIYGSIAALDRKATIYELNNDRIAGL